MKYSVVYKGAFFVGDKENQWNEYNARDWADAWGLYNMLRQDAQMQSYIKDHDEDLCYEDGEWY